MQANTRTSAASNHGQRRVGESSNAANRNPAGKYQNRCAVWNKA